jgi:uncharacterized protein involved in exopolysaccharide biosynthesis
MSELNQQNHQMPVYDDEIDLRELFGVLWRGKLTIIAIGVLATVVAVAVAMSMPNIYRSEAVLAPATKSSTNNLMSKYGGLASLAGISLPKGEADKTVVAMEVLQSRDFLREFVSRHENVLRDLIAVDDWNLSSNTLSFDPDLYNEKNKKWVREVDLPFKPEPSIQEAHEVFAKLLSVSQDKDSGLVSIAIEHQSPYVAQKWVEWLVDDINQVIRDQDVEQAEKSIAYLKEQISETAVADLQAGFFEMIQDQIQTIMLAKATPEYLFKTIDPAVVPELKVKPKRALIVVLGAVLGGMLGVMWVLIRRYAMNKE